MSTLRDALCELDKFQLEHLASIHIQPSAGGYAAVLDFNVCLPLGDSYDLPPGIKLLGSERWPQSYIVLEWRADMWEQILEAIHDPWLTSLQHVGNCHAVELAPTHGNPDSGRRWLITTHGKPHTPERLEWVNRCGCAACL
jgi:hypothetical protein